jgi:hypothetical protein
MPALPFRVGKKAFARVHYAAYFPRRACECAIISAVEAQGSPGPDSNTPPASLRGPAFPARAIAVLLFR